MKCVHTIVSCLLIEKLTGLFHRLTDEGKWNSGNVVTFLDITKRHKNSADPHIIIINLTNTSFFFFETTETKSITVFNILICHAKMY